MRIEDHRLVDVVFEQTPNVSAGRKITQELIVLHYTAGPDAESSVRHLLNPASQSSAHLVIGRDGDVTQLADFTQRAWHAGRSRWLGQPDVNSRSIGIELDNAGRLVQIGSTYRAWFGRSYPEDQVLGASHKNESGMSWWHAFTEPQLEACLEVCQALAAAYDIQDIVGHDDVSNKSDPGPAFPLESIRSRVFGREGDEPERPLGVVVASRLYIRNAPGGTLAGEPLPRGTEVEILGRDGDWLEVDVVRRGWVAARFIAES
jgi:N-acetylmuramoyl-L-alanine amidase